MELQFFGKQFFPKQIFKDAGSLGFMGMLIPVEYGGAGMGYHEYVAMIEAISSIDPSIGLSLAAHNSLSVNHIYMFGNLVDILHKYLEIAQIIPFR